MCKTKLQVGDIICVVVFPSLDVYGNEYDVYGGRGVVLEIKQNSAIVKLYDGAIIEADGLEFEILGR